MTNDQDIGHFVGPEVVTKYQAARERHAVDRYFETATPVLDLGCGAGRTSAVFAAEGYETVGLDVSRPMLGLAAEADPTVHYVAGDAATLPIADESFRNVLFSHNGIDALRPESARLEALREVYRVLEPGGHFAFSSHNLLRWLLPLPPTRHWLGKFVRFWLRNGREGLLGERYKRILGGPPTHFTDPLSMVRLLRAAGFDVVELLGNSGPWSTLVGNSVFLVVQKPKRARIRRQ